MLLKEKGYDEFVEQQIVLGKQAIKDGNVMTQDEAKRRTQAMIDRLALEFEQANHQQVVYG